MTEQSSINYVNIIKPSTHLPHILHNKISWVIFLKLLFIFKWVMQLRKWHRAGFKPTIKHLINSLKMLTINIKLNLIHPRAMVILKSHPREFIQLIVGTNYLHCALVTLPDRHRSCPKTITRQIPIWCCFYIFLESTML